MDTDQIIERAVQDGIREGVKSNLTQSYGDSPLRKLIKESIEAQASSVEALIQEGMLSALSDDKFRDEIKSAIRQQLAKTLVQQFGGDLQKEVNRLKSDPITRARITSAIDEIVRSASKKDPVYASEVLVGSRPVSDEPGPGSITEGRQTLVADRAGDSTTHIVFQLTAEERERVRELIQKIRDAEDPRPQRPPANPADSDVG